MMTSLARPANAAIWGSFGPAGAAGSAAPPTAAAGADGGAGAAIDGAAVAEHHLVLGNRFGKMPDQPRKLLDLGGQRLRRRRRLVGDAFELAFHGPEAASEFSDLAGDVARPAGKPGYLIVDLGAVGLAAGDRVIDRQRGQDAKCAQGRIGERKTEAEKQHRAQRRGDEHHAQCGKNGADAHHADPMAELIRVRAVSVSTRLAPPQVRPACGEGLAQAMARMTRPTFSNISPISASLAISGGAIASVSPVIRITRSSS